MIVTFRANAGVSKYRAGRIYTEELSPILKALLEKDTHLQLIDPPTLNPAPAQEVVAGVVDKIKIDKKPINKKPYNNSN